MCWSVAPPTTKWPPTAVVIPACVCMCVSLTGFDHLDKGEQRIGTKSDNFMTTPTPTLCSPLRLSVCVCVVQRWFIYNFPPMDWWSICDSNSDSDTSKIHLAQEICYFYTCNFFFFLGSPLKGTSVISKIFGLSSSPCKGASHNVSVFLAISISCLYQRKITQSLLVF